MSERIV